MARAADCRVAQAIITSPPYFSMRRYGNDAAEIGGVGAGVQEYVNSLVRVFNALPLAEDGCLWVNLGDAYAGGGRTGKSGRKISQKYKFVDIASDKSFNGGTLIAAPQRFQIAMIDAGWLCRQVVIWEKTNCIPERSDLSRPHCSIEYVFLFSKVRNAKWFAKRCAIAVQDNSKNRRLRAIGNHKYLDLNGNDTVETAGSKFGQRPTQKYEEAPLLHGGDRSRLIPRELRDAQKGKAPSPGNDWRAVRQVWTGPTSNSRLRHFAPMPEWLIERCIELSSDVNDVVLDPFAGSGTTLLVAKRLGRQGDGIELYENFADMAKERLNIRKGARNE